MDGQIRTGRHPGGRARKLTAEQEARVYAEYSATKRGKRFRKLKDLAKELGVCTRTLERLVDRETRRQFADFVSGRFSETDKTRTGDSP